MNDETITPEKGYPDSSPADGEDSDRSRSASAQAATLIQLEQSHIDAIARTVQGGADNVQDMYPLSPLQEGMLFHSLMNEGNDTYVLSTLLDAVSRPKLDALVDALQRVIARHDVLRTEIVWKGLPQPMQVVLRYATLPVQELSLDSGRDAREQLEEYMRPGRQQLQLTRAPIGRLLLAQDPQTSRWLALLQLHHLICDHQSLQIVVAEALACLDRRSPALPAPAAYKNYVAQALTHARTNDAKLFFKSQLGSVDEPTAPFGLLDVHGDGSELEEKSQLLETVSADHIRTQARRAGVSVARLFHAAWALVVARTSGRDDIVFGTVLLAAQQRDRSAQRMLGMSVNTLPLRLDLTDVTAAQLVECTHRQLTELLSYEHVPLTLAQSCSGISGTAPLFTALLNYRRNPPELRVVGDESSGVRVLARGEAWTNYPITLIVDDLGDRFLLTAQTNRNIAAERVIGYLQTALKSLVEALEGSPQTPASQLFILPESERRQIFERFNATQANYPRDKRMHELFEEQVERTPHAVAVTCGDRYLTYRQLNSRANQLASYLRQRGATTDRFVGLCVERDLEMAVGALGILKAGAAYVPLDPNYPQQRLDYIVKDTAPLAILTLEHLKRRLPGENAIVALDTDWDLIAQRATTNMPRAAGESSSDLAYVIYTSGSTGQPKGVAIEHRNAVNLIWWAQGALPSDVFDKTLHSTSLNFDLSIYELFVPLSVGGSIRIVPNALDAVKEPGVTLINTVPSAIKAVMDSGGIPSSVRVVNVAGEALKKAIVERIFAESKVECVCNLYGPSETTTYSTGMVMAREDGFNDTIGRPIANTRIYLLNRHGRPVPVGVVGEIYIGGDGVARGYLNRPELTAERFLRDPFSDAPQARMYKTGDLGRWRMDGTIEYLGRNDHQVKIRGFRVELGEIEARLSGHAQVKEAVVLAREDVPNEMRLVAYVVPHDIAGRPDAEDLRAHVKATLPDYMVPSAFVMLERLPLTPNGKLDRNALPAPELESFIRGAYEAPQGEVEEILAGIWQGLLGVERVGRYDNFFELGGHSLLIVQMLERLRRVGLTAEVRRVFESQSLSDAARALTEETLDGFEVPRNLIPPGATAITPDMLPLLELQPEHIERIAGCVPDGAAGIQDIYPLTPLQEGILFHYLLNESGGDTYVVPILLEVSSQERVEDLIAALQAIVDRHDVLRTAILWEQLPMPVQVVHRRAVLPVTRVSLQPGIAAKEQLDSWMQPGQQRLDLRQAPLLRLTLAEDAGRGVWYALVQLHHIISDNTSQEIVVSEVVAHLERRAQALPASVPYRNHVAQSLAHSGGQDSEAFFRGKLADVTEPTAPFGLLDVHGDGSHVEEADGEIDGSVAARIRVQARRLGVSTATLFHAAWALVLAHTSGRDDVVFGSVLSGRLQGSAGGQRILGMFINTLPLRLRLQGISARELMELTQRELVELLGHEQAPLVVAQRCSGIGGSTPLFSALLNYRHSIANPEARWSSASGIKVLADQERTNYPIVLSVDDHDDGFALRAQTDRRVDPHRIVGYLCKAVDSLVQALEGAWQVPVLSLPILPEGERRQVVELFNATQAVFPEAALTHELFEAQVQRRPEAVAVVYDGGSLTYAELNARANQLARYIVSGGVSAGDYIPIVMGRSLQMLIAELAVLKAGGVYVPMDPELPDERRAFMIHDCRARHVIVDSMHAADLDLPHVQWIDCASLGEALAAQSRDNLELALDSSRAAYVMYTSGSTGKPKGVIVPHVAINRLVINNGYAEIGPDDCIAHYSNPSFDASTLEIWGALLTGARILIVPQAVVLEAQQFAELLKRSHVTMLYMSVGLFNRYTQALATVFPGLRYLMVGGDALEPGAIRRVLRESPPQHLLNVYGPTECTTFSTTYPIDSLAPSATSVPIGRPMSNAQIYILDAHRQPVPIGVAGEIYIGGAGVALGYLNQPELTRQRFIPDPFSTSPRARLYRTGDLGRWLPDGVIDFLGRNDHQVKIRGFRIELGEIEAQLVNHGKVKQATVLARQDAPGEKRLVGYVVPTDARNAPSVEELRSHLSSVLPEYMVPGAIVMLPSMPLTSSGKVDRRALPAPEKDAYTSRQYEAPQGEVEEILASVWQGLLNVERVGRYDNFFELGGHSLFIVQMMERLRRVGLSTEVRRVFDAPTLAELAGSLTSGTGQQVEAPANGIPLACEVITPDMLPLVELEAEHIARIARSVPGGAANIQDIYPLAPLQEGILFHHLYRDQGGDTYVLPMVLSVASRARLQELIAALQSVIDRHDVLRTAVLWERLPRAVQVVYRHAELQVEEFAIEEDREIAEQIEGWIEPERQRIDIQRAPLMRLQVAADTKSERWYVLLQLHHMTIDHVSLEIVTSEVVAHLEGRAQQLPELAPYRNHVAQSLSYAEKYDAEAFFRSRLADIDEPTAPFGLLDVHGDGTQIDEARVDLDPELEKRLRAQARRHGVSAATLFHAAWGLVVAHTSGREDVVFGSVLLGRLQGSAGAQRTLGMFINTLPLRLRLHGMSARSLVEYTQRELVELLNHEQASLAVAQRCSGIVGTAPLFSALLNYRHSVPNPEAEWSAAEGLEVLAFQERTNYPITLSVDDLGQGFQLFAQTDRRVDPRRITGYLHTALSVLVDALEHEPNAAALALSILSEEERRHVLESFNGARAHYPRNVLVHELVEEQARHRPIASAVVHRGHSLTYGELNGRANRLARYLRSRGIGPDCLVGVCVERSLEMVVGLLAVLKAGAAYLPVDPNYPPERLEYMLQDAAPSVVLTQAALQPGLPATGAEIVVLDDDAALFAQMGEENLSREELAGTPGQLVYVIYTSGSTGKPKGTAMPHQAMVNLIEWHRENFRSKEQARVLQFAALSFDVAFQEIFSTLCTGGMLVLLDEHIRRDPPALLQLLTSHGIERLFVPPLMLQSIAESFGTEAIVPRSLRDVITAGEQLRVSPEIVSFFKRLGGCRLHNHYGPTETHVVTALTLADDPEQWPMLPSIGAPLPNTQIHILNSQRQPTPIGVAGEIHIGGVALARGYLRRPETTAQRFVADPVNLEDGARLYITGDVGRWRTDGTIEYLGRNDSQVKIRGYRIELGEIEAQLTRHPHVKEAAVIAREDAPGERRLVAYITRSGDEVPTVDELCAHLKGVLPEYMVPSAFVQLDSLPLTPSGKLNRRALPEPELGAYAVRQFEPPQGEVEQALAAIWQQLLGVAQVGREDNFFEIGGHSLLALKVLSRINQAFDASLRVTDAYKSPTIRELAARIRVGASEDKFVDLSQEAVLDEDIIARPGLPRSPAKAILLTGATGFVGRFLLAQLLQDTDATIHCMVRASTQRHALARLRTTMLKWDLWRDEYDERVVAVAGDLRLPRLGIDEATYELLAKEVDCIYHCATSMNHLETYTMAKPANVEAARQLLRLATRHKPKLVNYVSTLGVFASAASDPARVVDESSPIDQEQHPHSHGYVASKWVSEKIFMMASERGIPCNIFRLGLAWGDSVRGRFDELQNLHRVIKSCLLSGCGIEQFQYPMPPTPIDYVARSIVFLATRHREGRGIFHISSSRQHVADVFGRCNEIAGTALELMPYYEWICEMKRLHAEGSSMPATPLIEYAFAMDESAFQDHQGKTRSAVHIQFDFERTHRELEQGGIVAPELDDELLRLCIEDMISRDEELQQWMAAAPPSSQRREIRRDSFV